MYLLPAIRAFRRITGHAPIVRAGVTDGMPRMTGIDDLFGVESGVTCAGIQRFANKSTAYLQREIPRLRLRPALGMTARFGAA